VFTFTEMRSESSFVGRTESISSQAAIGRQHRALRRQLATIGWAWLEPSHPLPEHSMKSRGRALERLSGTRFRSPDHHARWAVHEEESGSGVMVVLSAFRGGICAA
jgi:hypothetical protein